MNFFSLWIGKSLSLYEQLSLRTFYDNDRTLVLYCNPELEVPDFVLRKPISDVIDIAKIYKINNSYASFANHFRYLAISKVESGNTWVDLDILYLRDFNINSGYVFGKENKRHVNNAVFSAPPSSELVQNLITYSGQSREAYWGATGPKLLTDLVGRLGLEMYSQPKESFYPAGPWEIDNLFLPNKKNDFSSSLQNSKTVHMYNEMIVRAGIPKNILPPRESFLGDVFSSYGFNYGSISSLDSDWIRGWSKNFTERKLATQIAQNLGPLKRQVKKIINAKISE
jgi:hypothetical protein